MHIDPVVTQVLRLMQPGVLGFYSALEVTEIVGFPTKGSPPVNVFTILVAEDRPLPVETLSRPLNAKRLKVRGLREWSFGVYRYVVPVTAVERLLGDLRGNVWRASGEPLRLGGLTPRPRQFVSPDAVELVAWNNVLKNNFWSGSYVFEWADSTKSELQALFGDPQRLQELSEAVQAVIPIRIASLSDRLGSVVLQLPATVLMANFVQLQQEGRWAVRVAWHPRATPRDLRATCELQFDRAISGYHSCAVHDAETPLALPARQGVHNGLLWDDEQQLILAATGSSAFIETVGLDMHIGDPEPRTFMRIQPDGARRQERVRLHLVHKSRVGNPADPQQEWTHRRMYKDEVARLTAERRFVQYRPQPGAQAQEHEKALSDMRLLIARHGENGAYLWDPYLSAEDILDTLFHCPHSGVELRALTAALAPADQVSTGGSAGFVARQRQVFADADGNRRGLRLEYRAKIGQAGWGFHDRFLIMPGDEQGALAWSLGTSVNSLGKQHHILQRVDDGQLVMDAFCELWNALEKPEHLVWRSP